MVFKFKTKPFDHQKRALEISAMKKNFAYFMEMGCVDGETEFLSNRGWIKFKDFDLDKMESPFLVAQVEQLDNKDYFELSFVPPEAYIEKEVDKFYHFTSDRCVDMMVTENHDCVARMKYVQKDYTYNPPLRRVKQEFYTMLKPQDIADFIDKKDAYPKAKNYIKDTSVSMMPTPFSGGGVKMCAIKPDEELNSLTKAEMQVQVAVMADGHFLNKNDNKCVMEFAKGRKKERFEHLCKKAGIIYVKQETPRNTTKYFLIAPVKCKVYDERFWFIDTMLQDAIFEEVWHWDGSYEVNHATCTEQVRRFYTSEKKSADFIQYLCNIRGFYCNISTKYIISRKGKPVAYTVTFAPKANIVNKNNPATGCNAMWCNISRYAELVGKAKAYCLRVPSGMLFLRRNFKTFITGNSGKTKVMIDNMGYLYDEGHITGAVILAPKGVYRNWSEKEIPTHLHDDVPREVLTWRAEGTAKYKKGLSNSIKNYDGKKLQVLVFNVESLTSDAGVKLIHQFIEKHGGNVLGIIDESTCIKNPKAKRTKAAIEIGQCCKVRRIATGSPITNSPLDLYSQCAFMDKRILGHGSFYSFRNTYATVKRMQTRMGTSYDQVIGYKNLDQLSEKIEPFSFRITKKECLDLPEKIYTTREVTLTKEQISAYKEMYTQAVAFFGDESMTVEIALTKMLRLHQILCGSFTTDDGEVISLPNNRVTELMNTIEELSGKIIIWANYVQNIKDIEEALKNAYGDNSVVTYYGGTSSDDRSNAIVQFQSPTSPVRFFVSNPTVGGRGITLTEADSVIYYSNNFSLETRQQSEDRNHRIGQKNNVTYIDLVVKNSLDEKIINALLNKRNIANMILKDELEEWISL